MDWNYVFPIDLVPIFFLFGAKSIRKVLLQSKFGLIQQDSDLCVVVQNLREWLLGSEAKVLVFLLQQQKQKRRFYRLSFFCFLVLCDGRIISTQFCSFCQYPTYKIMYNILIYIIWCIYYTLDISTSDSGRTNRNRLVFTLV